jgi:hypothetical protein
MASQSTDRRAGVRLRRARKAITAWLPAASLYSVALGIFHLYGYWSRFHVDVMAYLGLQDVIRVSVIPLLGVAFITFTSAGMMSLPRAAASAFMRRVRYRWGLVVVRSLVAALGVVGLLFWLWNFGYLWAFLAPPLVVFILAYVIVESRMLADIGLRRVRAIIVCLVILAPVWSFEFGILEAESVATGQEFNVAVLPESLLAELSGLERKGPPNYLGHVNDYDFFLMGQETVVIRSQALTAFSYSYERHMKHATDRIRIPFRDPIRW